MINCNQRLTLQATCDVIVHITDSTLLSAKNDGLRKRERIAARLHFCYNTRDISLQTNFVGHNMMVYLIPYNNVH